MLVNQSIISTSNTNDIRISNVFDHELKVEFKQFSIKYVVDGIEDYYSNNKKYRLKAGEFLVGNKCNDAEVIVDKKTTANGICIDVSKEIINEIIDYELENAKRFKEFLFENEKNLLKFNAINSQVGKGLLKLGNNFSEIHSGKIFFDNQIFYSLAELIVKDQLILFNQFNKLKFTKEETNNRIFEFIFDAKNFIENSFCEKINLSDIASEAHLSEYHFSRLFKKVFGISPYQFVIKNRLNFSKELLLSGLDVSSVAYQVGFANPESFSKAFKNAYGRSPQNLKNSKI